MQKYKILSILFFTVSLLGMQSSGGQLIQLRSGVFMYQSTVNTTMISLDQLLQNKPETFKSLIKKCCNQISEFTKTDDEILTSYHLKNAHGVHIHVESVLRSAIQIEGEKIWLTDPEFKG